MTRSREVDELEVEDMEIPEAPALRGTYEITFNQNRSFELTISRKTFFFEPYSKETLTEIEINHPDFKQQSQYFNVKEI